MKDIDSKIIFKKNTELCQKTKGKCDYHTKFQLILLIAIILLIAMEV